MREAILLTIDTKSWMVDQNIRFVLTLSRQVTFKKLDGDRF